MAQTLFQRSFASGEIAPALAARADLAQYLSGLKTCRNFFVRRTGGVSNRPGTRFAAEVKDSSNTAAIYGFCFLAGVAYVIEAGDLYLRFYRADGTPITVNPAAYDNAHAYTAGDTASSGGVNYVCVADTTGHAPPNGAYWYALAGGIYELPTT